MVADFCRRLRIREVVDELCPMREVSTSVVSHGQMVEVLVANRLTSPTPLRGVEDWAREWAVREVFGVVPEALNDDRAGRALEAIAPVLDKITGSVGLTAIEVFGLDVTRMHWDMTVRHEALWDRAEVEELRRLAVAAVGTKLRAA